MNITLFEMQYLKRRERELEAKEAEIRKREEVKYLHLCVKNIESITGYETIIDLF